MLPPSTPTRTLKADSDINSRIRIISNKWALNLPIRDSSWSPSRHTSKSDDQQIYERIRFLYFKDAVALDHAIAEFEDLVSTSWVPKPRADTDLLPSLNNRISTPQESWLKRRDVSDAKTAELRELLLSVLKLIADKVRDGLPYKTENIKKEVPLPTAQRSPMTKLPRQAKIADFFKGTGLGCGVLNVTPPVKVQQPSSDEFLEDDMDLFSDVVMPDAPYAASNGRPGSSDEEYKTPPQDSKVIHCPTNDILAFRKPQTGPVNHRKRSYNEPIVSCTPRNIRRERRSSEFVRSLSANELGYGSNVPATSSTPDYHQVLHETSGQTKYLPKDDLTRSFSSASSASMASANTGMLTGFTTPNTSFRAESVHTSFSSCVATDEPTTRAEVDPSNAGYSSTIRSTSEPPCSGSPANSDVDDNLRKEAGKLSPDITSVEAQGGNARTRIRGLKPDDYLEKYLFQESPFETFGPDAKYAIPFRQVYEIFRVSSTCKIPLAAFSEPLTRKLDDYGQLWTELTSIVRQHSGTIPERSSIAAWNRTLTSYDCVALTGSLAFSERPFESLFNFNLKPLKLEPSYRLSRKFGGDRFCIITIPPIEPNDVPIHLKESHNVVRRTLVRWLVDTDHHFLGRKWRAFYVKPEPTKRSSGILQKKPVKPGFRAFFFAEDGNDFLCNATNGEADPRKPNHRAMTVAKLIEWFMPPKANTQQLCLKFFSRLALAVSKTKPALQFSPAEIVRSNDAYANQAKPRRLNEIESHEKKNHLYRSEAGDLKVMNDGCARISRSAARRIAEILGLDSVPSVFQGRISGAKGLWMIDALDESLPDRPGGHWIEITDSQLKFESDPMDKLYPDPERVTFEVHSYSKRLSTADLNFQLMPILEDRGVPYSVFKRLLEEDLTAKVAELETAMGSPLALRKWNQDNNSVTEERLVNKGIDMLGGIPDSLAEKINWFVEHGFEPKNCRALKDYLYKAILEYCMRLENRMNIELGKSTYAYMIADPLALLEDNEVHIGFSSMFTDYKSDWSEVMLHDMDVLVARLPAVLPSDIQKVRAVFKPELGIYRDVVVFSSKGACSLAEKLSGGDFDGDKAWICWEPGIVNPFQNASVPDPVRMEEFGIRKDALKISDILHLEDYNRRFLLHAFDFNLRAGMLGTCTAFHENMCYHRGSITEKSAMNIAVLLGLLVDRAKAGIIFDEAQWNAYKREKKMRGYGKPAYKDKRNAQPKNHLIDNLVFKVAKGVRQDALGKFNKRFENVCTQDEDLVRLWVLENEAAKSDKVLGYILSDLRESLKQIHDFWKLNVSIQDDTIEMATRRGLAVSLKALVEKCRDDFLAIKPLPVESHFLTQRWKHEQEQGLYVGISYWDLLKASAAYDQWHKSGLLVWFVAGVEIGEIKVKARGKGSWRTIKQGIFEAFKLDNKVVRRRQEIEAGRAFEEEDDEFGDFDWDDNDI